MKRILYFSIMVIGLIFFGCLGTNTQPSQPAQTSCLDYCQSQPHIQCVGQWSISGSYPNCNCNFECTQEEAPQPPPTPTPNVTNSPPIQNTTQTVDTTPTTNQTVEPQPTRRTLNQTIVSHQEKIRRDFYNRGFDGRFTENKYTWMYFEESNPQNGVPIGSVNAPKVRRNGYLLNGTRAISSIEYTDENTRTRYAYAVVVLQTNRSGISENLGEDDSFDIQYGSNRLVGCTNYFVEDYVDNDGLRYSAYDLSCEELRRN
ncbi:MAG: hypothetical protein ACP5N9_05900 [Candidatus Bilamarchaeum sp.]